jgi:hypothetical protein
MSQAVAFLHGVGVGNLIYFISFYLKLELFYFYCFMVLQSNTQPVFLTFLLDNIVTI